MTGEERNESVPAPTPSPRSRKATVQEVQIGTEFAEERTDELNGDEPGRAEQSTGGGGRTGVDAP